MNDKIFRKEVFDSKKSNLLGEVLIISPVSLKIFTLLSLLIGLIILIFIFVGSYTKKISVYGHLMPIQGITQIYSNQSGILNNIYVRENSNVEKGDILFDLVNHNYNEKGDFLKQISTEYKNQEAMLLIEIEKTKNIQKNEIQNLKNEFENMQRNLRNISSLIKNQREKNLIYENTKDRYLTMLKEDAISKESYEIKNLEYINNLSTLEDLIRDENNLKNQSSEIKNNISISNNTHVNQILQLEKSLSNLKKDFSQNDYSSKQFIKSHVSGVISNINFEIGQFLESNKSVITITPDQGELIGYLYVPNNSIGFIELNDSVLLRYDAYPYQKFGHAKATIINISKAPAYISDFSNVNHISNNNDPVYLVKVKLNSQKIKVYGVNKILKSGMTFEADILQEKRKIYEWVLEPLFTISGKI